MATKTTTTKLTNAELKANYATERDAARAAHDDTTGKFTYMTFAQYKTDYNITWDFANPDEKDALPSTEAVLKVIDDAIDATVMASEKVEVVQRTGKMAAARTIFNEELGLKGREGLVRKDILLRFINEAGCTEKGANTYYNTIRSEHGFVKHVAAV